ncbi:hypothetical protein J6590_015689 [Homalodisca vitripennis]|nr:hypothetical protein J6590_015689 [Homalodisca vitripennis]
MLKSRAKLWKLGVRRLGPAVGREVPEIESSQKPGWTCQSPSRIRGQGVDETKHSQNPGLLEKESIQRSGSSRGQSLPKAGTVRSMGGPRD